MRFGGVLTRAGFVRMSTASVRPSALCPLQRVEAEIVAQMQISPRIYQNFYDICVAENYRENEGGLAAAGGFVYIRTSGQQRRYNFFVAGSYGISQWA
jgi:hypothetical protein